MLVVERKEHSVPLADLEKRFDRMIKQWQRKYPNIQASKRGRLVRLRGIIAGVHICGYAIYNDHEVSIHMDVPLLVMFLVRGYLAQRLQELGID
jgi:hypothetical protein